MMNNRIRELAKQAGYIDNGSNHTAYMNFDHEMFAELIIAECVSSILTSEQQAFLDRREYFAAVVQYHFGINDEQTN